MRSAAGTSIALFRYKPFATDQTTGSSRLPFTPESCCAFRASSSPSSPKVFFAATGRARPPAPGSWQCRQKKWALTLGAAMRCFNFSGDEARRDRGGGS